MIVILLFRAPISSYEVEYTFDEPEVKPQIVEHEKPIRQEEEPSRSKQYTLMEISAYTDAEGENRTASGKRTRHGYVAAGESFPFGTILYIEGYGEVEVQDRGGMITDEHLDIWFDNVNDALIFGRQHRKVYIVKWGG